MALSRTDARRRLAALAALAASLGVVVFVLVTAERGLDFGPHADEQYQAEGLGDCVDQLTLWPGRYVYHGLYFQAGAAVVLWHERAALRSFLRQSASRAHSVPFDPQRYPSVLDAQADAHEFLGTLEFRLQARRLFLWVSVLALFWLYAAMRRLAPDEPLAAAAAVAFLGFSWEWSYHARFASVDAPLAQFVALIVYLLSVAWTTRRMATFLATTLAAAAAAGLALGCKATGCFAVVPVLLTVLAAPFPRRGTAGRALHGLACLALVVVVFVFTTPGALFDPLRFFNEHARTAADYDVRWPGYAYYVRDRLQHASRVANWLTCAVPSKWMAVSIPLSVAALLGWVDLARKHRGLAAVLGVFVLVFLGFMSGAHLMIVRNYVLLTPLLALGFGGAIAFASRKLTGRFVPSAALGAVCAAVLGANAAWCHHAASSVATTTRATILADVAEHVRHAPRPLAISKNVAAALGRAGAPLSRCEPVEEAALPGPVLAFYDEYDANMWLSNRVGFVERTFSSYEVNYDWYSTWPGYHVADRIVLLSPEHARRLFPQQQHPYLVCR